MSGTRRGAARFTGALGAVACAAAVGVGAFARPFSVSADAAVAVILAMFVVSAAGHWRRWAVADGGHGGDSTERPASPAALAPWLVTLGGAASWEVFCFLSSPRAMHPTVSSLLDTFDATAAGRAVAMVAWIALGAYLVRR